MTDIFKFAPGDIVKRPYSLEPFSSDEWYNRATWVAMTPRKIVNQGTSGRGGNIQSSGERGATFLFLAPPTIAENIGHTWGAYDSIQSRIAEKAIGAAKVGRDLTSAVKGIKNIAKDAIAGTLFNTKNMNAGNALETIARKAYTKIGGIEVPKLKMDKPLIYQDSQRRSLVLEFQLLAEKDPKKDILDVVQDLQKYSSAGINQRSGIDIEFPYYFEVITIPGEAIKYTTCALEAVQSTYNVPWRNGFPVQATLQLTFKDISPLFRQTIQSGSIINVISRSEGIEFNQDPTSTISKNDSGLLTNSRRIVRAVRAAGGAAATGKALSTRVGQGRGSGSTLGI